MQVAQLRIPLQMTILAVLHFSAETAAAQRIGRHEAVTVSKQIIELVQPRTGTGDGEQTTNQNQNTRTAPTCPKLYVRMHAHTGYGLRGEAERQRRWLTAIDGADVKPAVMPTAETLSRITVRIGISMHQTRHTCSLPWMPLLEESYDGHACGTVHAVSKCAGPCLPDRASRSTLCPAHCCNNRVHAGAGDTSAQ